MKWPDTSPETGEDGWVSSFNVHKKKVGSFRLTASYSTDRTKPGYNLLINDQHLKAPAADLPSAKKLLIRTALAWAEKSVVALKEELAKKT